MKNWYSSIYNSFIIASIISFVIYFFSSSNIALGALISGYCLLVLAIIMILYIVLYNLMLANQNNNYFTTLLNMLMTCGPFLLMLYIVGFVLYLLITYKQRLIKGRISNNYITFNNITIIMILLQIYTIYININNDKFEKTKTLSKVTNSLLYLFGVIATISTMTLYTILSKFTADG